MYKLLGDNLEKHITLELMSHILGRKVFGFCKDNDQKDKIIKTTCYMLYNNLTQVKQEILFVHVEDELFFNFYH